MADRKQNWLILWLVVLSLFVWVLLTQWYHIQDDKQLDHENIQQEIEDIKKRLDNGP